MARRKFLKNPTPVQIAAIAVPSALALGGVIWGITAAKPAKKKKKAPTFPPKPECKTAPYPWDGTVVVQRIELLIDQGERDPGKIAQEVASALFGKHPSGITVTFPPGTNPAPGVLCVWTTILLYIDLIFKRRGIIVEPPKKPDEPDKPPPPPPGPQPVEFVTHTAADPGYPWEEPGKATIHLGGDGKHYPTPASFYDVEAGELDTLDEVIRGWLGSALAMAARAAGYSEEDVVATAQLANSNSSAWQNVRKELREMLNTVKFHRVYVQNNPNYAGGCDKTRPGASPSCLQAAQSTTYMMSPKGLGLDWRPVAADNKNRLAMGQKAKRTRKLDGAPLANVSGSSDMFLWLAALDLASLLLPNPIVATLKWSDGTSTKEPPPSVQKVGIDLSGVAVPA